ncbi:antibiotic biosynthesis monooxygenase family protein [Azorhizobium doebereinerae]|uniref:antibiotic biosynthesis monooxygenase family protein n=1 Tax=Azorhizobium doebereinerae TaxID=281091 RepID=UPI0003F5E1D9|nr:antibiotic biosynthesis monooxygenase [Azorhizobium doebereinerae]
MRPIQPHAPVYRLDTFTVPEASVAAFAALVSETHAVLRGQPGFLRDLVLEQVAGPGACNIATVVEWADAASYRAAAQAMAARHAQTGFDRAATLARLGVVAQIGSYQSREAA